MRSAISRNIMQTPTPCRTISQSTTELAETTRNWSGEMGMPAVRRCSENLIDRLEPQQFGLTEFRHRSRRSVFGKPAVSRIEVSRHLTHLPGDQF